MNYMRQVSKKKLVKWIEANCFEEHYGEQVSARDLLKALEEGELDMVKDYRIHGEEKQK